MTHCGGLLPLPSPLVLSKENRLFDLGNKADIDDLISLDKVEGKAFELAAAEFNTNFNLESSFILSNIKHFMSAPGYSIRASLCKLTIQDAGDEPLKQAAGTSSVSEDYEHVFGWLMIALNGGELQLRYAETSQVFSFGTNVNWAAFSTGYEHELRGSAIILTYKVYMRMGKNRHDNSTSLINIEALPIYQLFSEVRASFSEGLTMGFHCQHKYIVDRTATARSDSSFLLKGADALVYSAAKKVGLTVKFQPTYFAEDPRGFHRHEYIETGLVYLGERFGEVDPTTGPHSDHAVADPEIQWFCEPVWSLGHDAGHFGNTGALSYAWYQSAAVVVSVPPSKKRKHSDAHVQEELLDRIRSVVSSIRSVYCCGGSLVVPESGISVCFTKAGGTQGVCKFPLLETSMLADLLDSSCPAKFGKGKETVLDETYRKALALSSARFTTSLKLTESYILEEIQELMSSTPIRAELYNLNIYGVGEFFKPHTDTPRGELMFGSLVICLPCAHTGGELVVRQEGLSQRFAWGGNSESTLQWAAFYSDCEHEVKKVTSGYRVTITYNLYKRGVDELMVNPRTFPDFHRLLNMCTSKPKGSLIGIPCFYNYNVEIETCNDSKRVLKGDDAALFAAAESAGMNPRFVPVYKVACSKHKKIYVGETPGEKTPKFLLGYFDVEDRYGHLHENVERDRKQAESMCDEKLKVSWIKDPRYSPFWKAGHHVEDQHFFWYSSTAILLKVPEHEIF